MNRVILVQMLCSCNQKRLRNLVNKTMLLWMKRKIRHNLTKTNGGWILQKVFVLRRCHFLTFNRYSVGVFGQTICSKRGRITSKNTQTRQPRFCNSDFNKKKTESMVTFSIELVQNYSNLPSMTFCIQIHISSLHTDPLQAPRCSRLLCCRRNMNCSYN